MRNLIIGDRFTNSDNSVVWEFKGDSWLCVGGYGRIYQIGDKSNYIPGDSNLHEVYYWVYLGNYAKSSNLINLYEILSL